MNAYKAKALFYPLALLCVLVGVGLIYYGFELVSLPRIKEHHEATWVLVGVLLVIAGFLLAAFKLLKRPQDRLTGDQDKAPTITE